MQSIQEMILVGISKCQMAMANEKGSIFMEYGLLLAMLVATIMGVMELYTTAVADIYGTIQGTFADVVNGV